MSYQPKFPSVFCVGAAKAGTTALHAALQQCPDVFVPAGIKELNFMAFEDAELAWNGPGDRDNAAARSITDRDTYLSHFAGWKNESHALDCSPVYLWHPEAPARIRRYRPDAKIIIILRCPVECAFSMYSMMRRDKREPMRSFRRAALAAPERLKRGWEWAWDYVGMFHFGKQLARYIEMFPREQILLLSYKQWRTNGAKILREISDFLGIEAATMNGVDVQIYNRAPKRKELLRGNRFYEWMAPFARQLRVEVPMLGEPLDDWAQAVALHLNQSDRDWLESVYKEDISFVAEQTGWADSYWRGVPPLPDRLCTTR